MKHRDNIFHRCERWWIKRMGCPFVTEDKEDQEDTDEHEREFDKKQPEEEQGKVKVDVPAQKLNEATQELVTAGKIPETVLAEKVAETVVEPVPTIPKRAPAVIPKRFPKPASKPPVEVPSRVSGVIGLEEQALAYTGAKVTNAARIGVTTAYYNELEETGWTEYLSNVVRSNSVAAVNAQSASRGLSSKTLISAVILGGAAERLYTQYVAGSTRSISEKGKTVKRRGKQTTPRQIGPKQSKARGVSKSEAKSGRETVRDVERSLTKERQRRANREARRSAREGAKQAVKKFTGGRGGFHKPASKFRGGARDVGLFR